MRTIKLFFLSTILLLQANTVMSQLAAVKFVQTDPYSAGLQSLWLLNVKSQEGQKAYFTLKLYKNGISFYEARTDELTLISSESVLNLSRSRLAYESYTNPEEGAYVKSTGLLPKGAYSACVEMVQNSAEFHSCVEFFVSEELQLNQIYPPHQFEFSSVTKQPTFVWTLNTTKRVSSGLSYSLSLFKRQPGQNGADAALRNQPMHKVEQLFGNSYTYPIDAVQLEENGKYVWMVAAEVNRQNIATSTVWEFTFKSEDKQEKAEAHSYIDLNQKEILSEILANGELFLKFEQRGNQKVELSYEFHDLKGKKLKNKIPSTPIKAGENYFSVDLSSVKGLQHNHVYIVKIKSLGNRETQLVFKYLEK